MQSLIDEERSKGRNLKRKYQEIDGARLDYYNEEDDSFQVDDESTILRNE